MIRLCAIAILAAGSTAAQEVVDRLPALHSVTGVASDDVLNIRSATTASGDKIGELAPDANGVEVTEVRDGWARVNIAERSGWASLEFLAAEAGGTLPDVSAFTCFGTEPFWSLEVAADGRSTLSEPDGESEWLTGPVRTGEGRSDRFAVVGGAADRVLALSISAEGCDDGMSDRHFGLSATLITTGAEARTLSGCCSLAE